jgi:Uma2 family endonuclease
MAIRIAGHVNIPDYVRDHESFRRWARSPECPEHLRVAFYDGDLWVDPEMEQLYVHNQVKLAVSVTVAPLIQDHGIYVGEGMLLTNAVAGLSTLPDGYYVSDRAFETGRAREIAGQKHGFTEVEGSPEMVLEVVSDSSVTKDLVDLRRLYWESGIDEYWVIDARSDEPIFELLKHGPKVYTAVRKQAGGWLRSEVIGRSFRLIQKQSRRGRPSYTLEVK